MKKKSVIRRCNFRGYKCDQEKVENTLKYKDLTIEIQLMTHVKHYIVITESTGTISKSFRKYPRNIPGKHEIKSVQNTAILGRARILR